MNAPIISLRTRWWERRLVRMFGRKVCIDGKFVGWLWNGRFYV